MNVDGLGIAIITNVTSADDHKIRKKNITLNNIRKRTTTAILKDKNIKMPKAPPVALA